MKSEMMQVDNGETVATKINTQPRGGITPEFRASKAGSIANTNPAAHPTKIRNLSDIDKKLLKILLNPPNGKPSSHALAAKLGIPRTTVQRRRAYLEKHFLEFAYALKLKNLGYRRVDLLIYTGGGNTTTIAEKLLDRDEVVYVGKSIGEHTIDLRAEVIIRDNSQLLDLMEEVKSMLGVRDVIWSEIVQIVGRKRSIPELIIDKL